MVPTVPPTAGAALRRLTVETDGATQLVVLPWNATSSLPAYAEAFDILDGVIGQLTAGAVGYPSTQSAIVRDLASYA